MKRRPGLGAVVLLAMGAWVLVHGCGSESTGGDGDADTGPAAGSSGRARVVRVIDGDTIAAEVDGRTEDVRYIGIDTPETVKPDAPVQCFGPQASAANHRLVEGRTVRLVFDRETVDDYGRLLAYVYARGRFVNAELIRRGLARPLRIAPNTAHAAELQRLATRAAGGGRGLWGRC